MGLVEFHCSCGFTFQSRDNRSYTGWLLADEDFDAFWDLIDAAIEKSGPTPLDKERAVMDLRASLFEKHPHLWQCPECGLVYIPDSDGNRHAHAPVGDAPRDLFAGRGVEYRRVRHRTDPS